MTLPQDATDAEQIDFLEVRVEELKRERDDYKHAAGAEAQLFNEARAALTAAREDSQRLEGALRELVETATLFKRKSQRAGAPSSEEWREVRNDLSVALTAARTALEGPGE